MSRLAERVGEMPTPETPRTDAIVEKPTKNQAVKNADEM
jgi:hypothetical protein